MTKIAFRIRGCQACHTEVIFPGRSTIYLREIVHYTGKDACGMTGLIRICHKKTLAPAWHWPLTKSSASVVIFMVAKGLQIDSLCSASGRVLQNDTPFFIKR